MKKIICCLFAIITVYTSCKKPVPDLALFVPKDASVVFVVDAKALSDKITSSGMNADSLVNRLLAKNENGLQWQDIKNAGLDLSKPLFMFTKQTSAIKTGQTKNIGFIASVKDKEKLVAFFKKQYPAAEVEPGENYQYMALGDDFVAGWNDKALIISLETSGTFYTGKYSTGEHTLSQQQLSQLFSQDEAASIASVGGFRDMISTKGDAHYYLNPASNLAAVPMLGMSKLSTLFEDTYTTGIIDFEKGKAVATGKSHLSKTLTDILAKYPSKTISKDMLTRYPYTADGFGLLYFNPKVILDVLQYAGFDGMADTYTSQMGFTTADIINSFSGNMAFIFSPDVQPSPTGISQNNFLVNLEIGDKAAFNKMFTALVNKNIITKNGNTYRFVMFGGGDFIIETTADNLFIASSDALIKAYQSNSKKMPLPNDVEKEMGNKSMVVYADINKLISSKQPLDTSAFMQTIQSTFKDFTATTDKGNDKTIKGTYELNFVNGNENSLASLLKFLAAAKQYHTDNSIIPPSLDEDGSDSLLKKNNSY